MTLVGSTKTAIQDNDKLLDAYAFSIIKGEIVSARRRGEEASLVPIENPAGDKMKGKGRT